LADRQMRGSRGSEQASGLSGRSSMKLRSFVGPLRYSANKKKQKISKNISNNLT
jgi:hypothetical protein